MSDADKTNNSEETNYTVDKVFSEYMYYTKTADLNNIQNCMKRNLRSIQSSNTQNYNSILGLYNYYNFWGKIDPEKNEYELIENRSKALKEHHSDLTWLYGRLCDYRSRKALFGIVENWLTFSTVSLTRIMENSFRQYFDLDIIKCGADEVFVDIGAYYGDTVNNYMESYRSYKKIYCYEIFQENFQKLTQNLESYPNIEYRMKGAGDKNDIMSVTDEAFDMSTHMLSDSGKVKIPVVKIDDDITEPVSFIKMDIEGGEQKAIIGCKNHIQSTHPKLAISIYHNNEDIWKCARIIDEIYAGYKFYIRYYGGYFYPTESVLYCV